MRSRGPVNCMKSKATAAAFVYLTLYILLAPASAQVQQAWVARFGTNGSRAIAITVDEGSNVYVTGGFGPYAYGGLGYETVKYGANGNQIWAVRRDTEGFANAVAADSAGNVYVTGYSRDHFPGRGGFATLKYNSQGVQLWEARIEKGGRPTAVLVNEAGDVYMTGSVWAEDIYVPGRDGSYLTAKYDSNGTELWVRSYDGPGGGPDVAKAMGLDRMGNVYVTGSSGDSRLTWGAPDFATVKYDPDGNQLWVARYSGPANGIDYGNSIALDTNGSIYVTGPSWATTGSYLHRDYITIKYDATGREAWVARYNGPGNTSDTPMQIAVDPEGNILVTGFSLTFDNEGPEYTAQYLTVKYSSGGQELWVARSEPLGGDNEGDEEFEEDHQPAMRLDAAGNVYVTGTHHGYLDRDPAIVTLKYDTHGNQLWCAKFRGFGSGGSPRVMALDPHTNVYILGLALPTNAASDYPSVLIKFVQSDVPGLPRLIDRPQSQTVLPGAIATFAASAAGDMPMEFQWRHNGTNIPGAINSTLMLTNVRSTHAGDYSVQVRNAVGLTVSPEAHLIVASRFSSSSYVAGAGFQFNLTGETGRYYCIQVSSNLMSWTGLTQLLNSNGAVQFTDSASTNLPRRFYRAVQSP